MLPPTPVPSATGLTLLCVDLQPVFLKVIPDHERLSRRCLFAIQAAAGLDLPVIFTEQVPDKLGGTSPELLRGTSTAKIFPKATFSALADPEIRQALTGGSTEHVLLCGIETSVCVHQTALDALAGGWQVTILSDCVGARRSDDAQVCLTALIRAGAHVLPAETVFYSLLHDVRHPFFRAYTQLVKTHA